ncbi:sigma-70 family RNA polymerase sigma factor [Gordonia sp. (in: high G+C Gram-positive bacteria)]|uniref:sigma-70 family RNA polymerase sigma factor n=1 Tax=Gordonia sp. (in: high G+C Gram-positive bacteria) TaxID=84139 RepID=UPI003C75803E
MSTPALPGAESAAETFENLRPRLIGVAYGLLGSVSDAEDVVQDAWIRLQGTDIDSIDDLTGWLVTTTSRLALDVLRSARVRRESYVGPWLPEPVETAPDPADSVGLADSVSWAMLVVLETLSPAERAAFVLHDLFGLSFDEVGTALGRAPAACRQLASRARSHVQERRPRFDVDPSAHHDIVDAFAAASMSGDLGGLLRVLAPDAVLTADGGGIVQAARHPIVGAAKIAAFLAGISKRHGPEKAMRTTIVNHNPALLVFLGDHLDGMVALTISDGLIVAIDYVRNPEKLTHVHG